MPDNVIKTDIQDYWRRSYVGDKEIPSSNVEWDVDELGNFQDGRFSNIGGKAVIGEVYENWGTYKNSDAISCGLWIKDCIEGDTLILTGTGESSNRLWAFFDKDHKLISVASSNAVASNLEVIAPSGTRSAYVGMKLATKTKAILHRNSSRLYAGDKEVDIMYAGDKVAYAKHKDNLLTALGSVSSGSSKNNNNKVSYIVGHLTSTPYQILTVPKEEGVIYSLSFDVTDFNSINLKYFIISGEPTSKTEFKGVGHYVITFKCSRSNNDVVLGLYRQNSEGGLSNWNETDKYCIIKNIKLERNIVDTEYSLAPSVTDNRVKIGKHWYNTCTIGSQEWLSENLNEDLGGGTWEGYYNNDPNYGVKGYGKLYTWDCICSANETPSAAMAKLLKDGWRVPTKADFDTLVTSVGGSGNYANVREKWYWGTAGTNESGFSALGSGYCAAINESFGGLGVGCYIASSSKGTIDSSKTFELYTTGVVVKTMEENLIRYAISVRLVRDVPVTLSAPPTTGSAYVASVDGNVGWVSE